MTKMPMGWGVPGNSIQQNFDAEKAAFDALADVVPERLMRKAAKPVINQALLDKTYALQKAAGFDEGFSFRFFFHAIMGRPRDWLAQIAGTCVESGSFRTTVDRGMAEVFLLNDTESLPGSEMATVDNLAFFSPYSYRAGRREAGIDGNGDGSLCLPHIRGKMKFGHIKCDVAGLNSDAYPEPQNVSLYRKWGADNRLMDQFQGGFKLMESEPVSSFDSAKTLLTEHFKPMNICSMWAFKSTGKRIGSDAAGRGLFHWTRDRGDEWAHNMQVIGALKDASGKWWIDIDNQWKFYHDGNTGFLVSADEFDVWGRDAEIQSVGELDLEDNQGAFPE